MSDAIVTEAALEGAAHHGDAATRPAYKDIAYGSAAGIVSKLFEHPFDLVKVRLQSQPLDRPLRFHGPLDCMVQTFKGEGLRGLWRGVSMPVGGAMAENATLFVVYNQTQALLRHLFPPPPSLNPDEPAPLSIPQIATAAALAGAAASFVLTPVELVKCKMQVQNIVASAPSSSSSSSSSSTASAGPGPKAPTPPGPVAITRAILADSGPRGLWLGQTGTFLRETGGSAAWFTTFELLSSYFARRRTERGETSDGGGPVTKGDLAAWELMASGATAGVVYNCVLFPADCIKSTIQTEDELLRGAGKKRIGPRRGFLQVGQDIYRARGVKGLYSGCGLTAMRAAPSSALIFYIYSRLESIFG
ncbi:SPOSA6832_04078 [Sporobolomyces salmonicolor]|uniref:SPOSA6832_04078-mRNA-1:cds n=1 Tax=Sporidiobolus salmonicolor TaxID=5005 RepID=A0A0D6ER72_SPOSA|nr:SPOSA6832_04078 [Sporobolomyces salmonicolor]